MIFENPQWRIISFNCSDIHEETEKVAVIHFIIIGLPVNVPFVQSISNFQKNNLFEEKNI